MRKRRPLFTTTRTSTRGAQRPANIITPTKKRTTPVSAPGTKPTRFVNGKTIVVHSGPNASRKRKWRSTRGFRDGEELCDLRAVFFFKPKRYATGQITCSEAHRRENRRRYHRSTRDDDRREYERRWREAHREAHNKSAERYRLKRRSEDTEYAKRSKAWWAARNRTAEQKKQAAIEACRKWRANNRDAANAACERWARNNPSKLADKAKRRQASGSAAASWRKYRASRAAAEAMMAINRGIQGEVR